MKKIAIATLYGNYNYGNKLQNYALQTYLENKDCDVYTLKNNHSTNYKQRFFLRYIKNLIRKCINRFTASKQKIKKEKKFILFNKKYIRYYKKFINTFNLYKTDFDLYIVGSDQVWNPDYGLDDVFLLKDISNQKKISYSASFGVTKFSDYNINKIKNEIGKFNKISVREYEAKEIIEKYTNRNDVQVTLDPTFLLSREQWSEIISKEKLDLPDNYIFTYFLGNGFDEKKDDIYKYAKKYNLEVINIMDEKSKYYSSNPFEFLLLIKNASLILTDSFHACVFSIIFNKKFMIYERKEKNNGNNMISRINSLMKTFELNNYYDEQIENTSFQYDDKKCQKIIANLKERTDEYFNSIIGD